MDIRPYMVTSLVTIYGLYLLRQGFDPPMPRFKQLVENYPPAMWFDLSLYRDRLQFEMPADQDRSRTDEFARGIIFRREVTRINGIELLKQRQIRARDLHVHQIIHRHSRLSQDFFVPIKQEFDFVFYLLGNFARLRINPNSSCQIQCVSGKNSVAEWRLHWATSKFNHFA